jgi:hypothetical protein
VGKVDESDKRGQVPSLLVLITIDGGALIKHLALFNWQEMAQLGSNFS